MQLVQPAHHLREDLRHLREALRRAAARLPDLEDTRLRLVQQLARLAPLGRIGRIRDRRADLRELAHDRALANDLGIAANVRGRRRAGGKLVQVRKAAHVGDLARVLERLGDRQHVGGLVVLDELGDDAPEQAMVGAIEVRFRDDVADAIPRGIGKQQPPRTACSASTEWGGSRSDSICESPGTLPPREKRSEPADAEGMVIFFSPKSALWCTVRRECVTADYPHAISNPVDNLWGKNKSSLARHVSHLARKNKTRTELLALANVQQGRSRQVIDDLRDAWSPVDRSKVIRHDHAR